MLKRYLEAGQIVGTHGVRGELRVAPWCDSPEFLTQFEGFYLEPEGGGYRRAEAVRVHKSLALVKFEGIDDIQSAMGLIRKVIYIDRRLVSLPEGCYFEQDLLGLSVVDAQSGRHYGTISAIQRTGANDVYGVKDRTGKEVFIPAIRQVIVSVDPEGGRMLISPLKGLFEDED